MKHRGNSFKQSLFVFLHSIRFRLVLWFVLILGVVMAIFSGFIYWRQSQDIRSIALEQLNFTTEHILGPAHERESVNEQLPIGTVTPENPQGLISNLQEYEVVALQSPDGAIQQSSGTLTKGQIEQLDLPQNVWNGVQQVMIPKIQGIQNRRYLFMDTPILQNGQITNYLLVGVPLDINNQLGRLLVSLVLGNLFTLAIALTGGFWLADKAMRPVHTITQTAKQIGETDLNKRLHLQGKGELSELGNTFDEMLNRLQAAFERQRQFTADASHELRTPLTIIDLESNRGLSSRRSVDEYERILGTIQSENKFMIRLVNNLLSLARMDAGQVNLKDEPIDLGDLVSEVVERMGPVAAAQGVVLSVGELPEIMVRGDHPTLIQMLTNLVENAIKYTTSVPYPQVSISAGRREAADQQVAWVQVCDNGIGISSEHQAHIFDRFYQVDIARSRINGTDGDSNGQESSGTGLGLAISQWIVHAHHGEIRVESAAGRGSTFEVILPVYKPEI